MYVFAFNGFSIFFMVLGLLLLNILPFYFDSTNVHFHAICNYYVNDRLMIVFKRPATQRTHSWKWLVLIFRNGNVKHRVKGNRFNKTNLFSHQFGISIRHSNQKKLKTFTMWMIVENINHPSQSKEDKSGKCSF